MSRAQAHMEFEKVIERWTKTNPYFEMNQETKESRTVNIFKGEITADIVKSLLATNWLHTPYGYNIVCFRNKNIWSVKYLIRGLEYYMPVEQYIKEVCKSEATNKFLNDSNFTLSDRREMCDKLIEQWTELNKHLFHSDSQKQK